VREKSEPHEEPAPPKLHVSKALRERSQGFVKLDRQGGVVPAWRQLLLQALITVAAVLYFWRIEGESPWRIALWMVGIGAVIWVVQRRNPLNRTGLLIQRRRFTEAEALLAKVTGPPKQLALVAMNRAAIAWYQGKPEEELRQREEAERLHVHLPRQYRTMNQLGLVGCLTRLGRLDEARALLGSPPTGDYMLLGWWQAELLLAMAEGAHTLSRAELERRLEAARQLRVPGQLLEQLAWAFHELGDSELAWKLLREALPHRDPHLPRNDVLGRWVDQHAAAAGLQAPYR